MPAPDDNPFRIPDFRYQIVAVACATIASRGLASLVAWQVFDLTNSKFLVGILGLVEAIPALALALYGGHIADRHDRRKILQITTAASAIGVGAFAAYLFALEYIEHVTLASLLAVYAVAFNTGVARGFADPAMSALEAQIVPRAQMVKASAWLSTTWLSSSIIGPICANTISGLFGLFPAYLFLLMLFTLAWIAVSRISSYPVPPPPPGESIYESVAEGVKYVRGNQVMWGSMALDLFAVLFGGAMALLPVFAKEILHVEEIGYGFLNASMNAGALLTMLVAVKRPPIRHAGRNLLLAVAGFGVAMIVFALSTNFYLSLAMLFIAGMCDGVSVVIRRSIVRLMTPPRLRGRVASVSMVFIGASNEIGAFESGLAAHWLGTVPSVWMGAMVTLLIVAWTAWKAPQLRTLRLDGVLPAEEAEPPTTPADSA